MTMKNMTKWCVPLALILGSSLHAEEGSNMSTESVSESKGMENSHKVGLKFRSELAYTPNSAIKDESSSMYVGAIASPSLDLKINSKVDFHMEFEATNNGGHPNCMGSMVKTAYTTAKISDNHWVKWGCLKSNKDGWDFADWNSAGSIHPKSVNRMDTKDVFKNLDYQTGIEFGLNLKGTLSLQLWNDVQNQWNKSVHLTPVLDWRGDFNGLKPMVQIGSYDDNHSMFTNVGVKGTHSHMSFALDVLMNSISNKVLKTGSTDFESKPHTTTSIVALVEYMHNSMTPYLYLSNYSKKQAVTDAKFNTGNWSGQSWDDNGMLISLGSKFHSMGDNYTPYAAIDMLSGDFQNPTDVTKAESKSDTTVRFGVTASF